MEAKPEAKTITDICFECLERIFDFLDLESLLNVADTCKRLQMVAATKYGNNYGGKTIFLSPPQKPGVSVADWRV